MQSIEEFLSQPERRTHVVNDLNIEPITVYEMMLSEREEIMEEYSNIHSQISEEEEKGDKKNNSKISELGDKRTNIVCKVILKAIFGYDKDYSDEQAVALKSKYSDAVIDELFTRIVSFNSIDAKAISKAKKT